MLRAFVCLAAAHVASTTSGLPAPLLASRASRIPRRQVSEAVQEVPDALRTAGVPLEKREERVLTRGEVEQERDYIVIGAHVYNVSSYLRKHPGGRKVIEPFLYGRNATAAFDAERHSQGALRMLEKLKVGRLATADEAAALPHLRGSSTLSKFFTKEDPLQLHKTLGIYVLLHYIYRLCRVAAGDPTAGFSHAWSSLVSVLPHALLSGSSFIFHVPRERVTERPMIWQEFRAHNVCFALRSFIAFVMLWTAEHAHQHWVGGSLTGATAFRGVAVTVTAAICVAAMRVADVATRRLRLDSRESTTATMPYWNGCSDRTQSKFKAFYTFAQVMATAGILASVNLSWPLIIMMPIQLASLLMTCVRKGALSTRGYHYIYTASLLVPFFVGLRTEPERFPFLTVAGICLYLARLRLPRGSAQGKYALWSSAAATRVAWFAGTGM